MLVTGDWNAWGVPADAGRPAGICQTESIRMPKPKAVVDPRLCRPEACGEGICEALKACEKRTLKQEGRFEIPYASDLCLGCAQCVLKCPLDAIRMI